MRFIEYVGRDFQFKIIDGNNSTFILRYYWLIYTKVLFCGAFMLGVLAILLCLFKFFLYYWLTHGAQKFDADIVKLKLIKSYTFWVVPFTFVLTLDVLLVVIPFRAYAISS